MLNNATFCVQFLWNLYFASLNSVQTYPLHFKAIHWIIDLIVIKILQQALLWWKHYFLMFKSSQQVTKNQTLKPEKCATSGSDAWWDTVILCMFASYYFVLPFSSIWTQVAMKMQVFHRKTTQSQSYTSSFECSCILLVLIWLYNIL